MESAALIRNEEFRASDLNPKQESCFSKINWFYAGIFFLITAGVFAMGILLVFMIANFGDDEEINNSPWKPKGDKIKTAWAETLTPDNVWQEYPRPQLQRDNSTYVNLNGLWDYYKTKKGSIKPKKPNGQILVPFPIESSLSGVMETLTEEEELWYQRSFELPEKWRDLNNKIFLHFGAVDWKCQVYVNYKLAGEHTGGYTPFSLEISNYLNYDKSNTIIVKVYDPSNTGYQPRGKQTLEKDKNIWYTASSGIWQTVWVEKVNTHYVQKLEITPDYDNKQIKIKPVVDTSIELKTEISLSFNGKEISKTEGFINQETVFTLSSENFHAWSNKNPYLYNISLTIYSINSQPVDKVSSYTALRKIEKKTDSQGTLRIFLNDEPLFNMGVLDQGFFPDGLYTPPCDDAQINDIQKVKSMGFNTIRKHMKVENARYYYHCDRLGMLVWQDMPAGDIGGNEHDPSIIDGGTEKERTEESISDFYQEWQEIIEFCGFFQSIIVWVPFNEAWGQFETVEVAEFTHNLDPSRLVDHASGGNYRLSGDLMDFHHYPNPRHDLIQSEYINVVGEYGGIGLLAKDHSWTDQGWSHEMYNTTEQILEQYEKFSDQLITLKSQGIAGAIFTQTTDVELEVNGLMTYDRKIDKYNAESIKQFNDNVMKNNE